jgi:hypothetical protein
MAAAAGLDRCDFAMIGIISLGLVTPVPMAFAC